MNIFKRMRSVAIFPVFFAVVLSGCGGGGSSTAAPTPTPVVASTIVSGTAAAGAPIVGYVSVRDSSANAQPVKTGIPIAADGKYSVDVSGLKAPFAFLADGTVGGKRVQYYSAATQADVGGTINITPFTDLMIRNIAGTIATTLADAISLKLSNLTSTQLDAERVKLTNELAPVLLAAGLDASIDLLRASFNTDHTGLDRFMDLVKVDSTNPTAVTITNILDADKKLTINTAAGTTTGGVTLSSAGVTAIAVATPVDLIVKTFSTFSSFFATSLPKPDNPDMLALFSSTFKDGGQDSAAFLTQITTDKSVIGLKFANVVVDSVDTVAGTAKIHFSPLSASGANLADDQGGVMSWNMKRSATNTWLVDGDQRIAKVRIRTVANKSACNPANTTCALSPNPNYQTGLDLNIDNKAMQAIGSAVVTGPGLPASGVTLTAQPNQTNLHMPVAGCNGCTDHTFAMTDALIAAIPVNSVYTVKLYSNAVSLQLLATYTETVPVAPVLNSALPTMAFPSIGNMIKLVGFTGGTLTPSWAIPTGLSGRHVGVWVCV